MEQGKLCECGCGQALPIRSYPTRFIRGHNRGAFGDPVETFMSHVDRSPAGDGCWEWTAGTNPQGYGKCAFKGRHGVLAHRAAWEIATGSDAGSLFVLHRCDNPACVRPDHLFLGTCDDNHKDKAAKGRSRNGWQTQPDRMRVVSAGPQRKVSDQQVSQILALKGSGVSQRKIASLFRLSEMTISHIVRGHRKYVQKMAVSG